MKRVSRLLCCLGALLVGSSFSHALTIPASEDGSSFGNRLSIVGNKSGVLSVDASRKAYVYFDLSEIPATAVVRWAKLRLFLPQVRVKGSGINVHAVTGEWNEALQSDEPAISATPVGTLGAEKLATKRFVTVDVTSTVQDWINLKTRNEGFAFVSIPNVNPGLTSVISFSSKEGIMGGLPAELDIDFEGSAESTGKTILNGTVAPSTSLGNLGDFYLNTAASAIYGPKTASGWGAGTSLVGRQGLQGVKGDTGASGPVGSQGPQGLTGATGAVGPQGIQGIKGDTGLTGAVGPQGLIGVTGPQGIKGDAGAAGRDGKTVLNGTVAPSGSIGSVGDFYLNTEASTVYGPKTNDGWGIPKSLVGPTGPRGDVGAPGAQGPKGDIGPAGGTTPGAVDFVSLSASLREVLTPAVAVAPTMVSPGTLGVAAQGVGNLSYQWLRDGVEIAGGTGATYALGGAADGVYSVRVNNAVAGTFSDAVRVQGGTLAGVGAVSIVAQPQGAQVIYGTASALNVGLSVDARSPLPVTYQWKRNGVDIVGATSGTYTALEAGTYSVVASNAVSSVTSVGAEVQWGYRMFWGRFNKAPFAKITTSDPVVANIREISALLGELSPISDTQGVVAIRNAADFPVLREIEFNKNFQTSVVYFRDIATSAGGASNLVFAKAFAPSNNDWIRAYGDLPPEPYLTVMWRGDLWVFIPNATPGERWIRGLDEKGRLTTMTSYRNTVSIELRDGTVVKYDAYQFLPNSYVETTLQLVQ